VDGWKLHLLVNPTCHAWLPFAADLTPANAADNEQAPALIENLPPGTHFLLGDQHYYDEALFALCGQQGGVLVVC
jgi:hypothetical protein